MRVYLHRCGALRGQLVRRQRALGRRHEGVLLAAARAGGQVAAACGATEEAGALVFLKLARSKKIKVYH